VRGDLLRGLRCRRTGLFSATSCLSYEDDQRTGLKQREADADNHIQELDPPNGYILSSELQRSQVDQYIPAAFTGFGRLDGCTTHPRFKQESMTFSNNTCRPSPTPPFLLWSSSPHKKARRSASFDRSLALGGVFFGRTRQDSGPLSSGASQVAKTPRKPLRAKVGGNAASGQLNGPYPDGPAMTGLPKFREPSFEHPEQALSAVSGVSPSSQTTRKVAP
jgi:hypothetical protein